MVYPFDVSWMRASMVHGGSIFFVNSTHASKSDAPSSGGSPDQPFATLAYAITQATASKGDVIYLMPGHAETTTAIAMNKAGTKIAGVGFGRNRPTLTATTAVADLMNVTAANVELENIRLAGAASGVTALLDLGSAADDFYARRVSFEQAATPLEGITISAQRWTLEDCDFIGTANGPDRCISIEARSDQWKLIRPRILFPAGLDNEIIKSVKVCLGYLIEDVRAVGLDTLVVNFASSSSGPPDGYFTGGTVMYSAAVTSIEDGVAAATSLGMAFGRLYAADVTGKASGLIPLTTAS